MRRSALAATGLNRHSPGSASPPGLSTSALDQELGFARKRPFSQFWIEDPVPYVEMRSCPNSNGDTTAAGLIEPSITAERASRNLFRRTCLRRMRKRPFVIEDLTEVAGIDPHAARRASVKIRSFLWRWPVLSARNVVHGRQNPRTNAEVSIARMRAAQSNVSKTPCVELFQDDFTQDVGIALAGLGNPTCVLSPGMTKAAATARGRRA